MRLVVLLQENTIRWVFL